MNKMHSASLTRGCFAAAVAAVLMVQSLVSGTTPALAEETDDIAATSATDEVVATTEDGTSEDEGFTACGTCEWRVDEEGELLIRPIDGDEGTLDRWDCLPAWHDMSAEVTRARFEGTVHAQTCESMFYGCRNCTSIDLTGLDTSECDNTNSMFDGCWALEKVDISMLDTRGVMLTNSMYADMESLVCIKVGSKNEFYEINAFPKAMTDDGWWSYTDQCWYSSWTIMHSRSGVADTYFAKKPEADPGFTVCGTCQWRVDEQGELLVRPLVGSEGTLDGWGGDNPWTSRAGDIESVRFEGTVHAADCYSLFAGCTRLRVVQLEGLDTSGVTDMCGMFKDCENLRGIDLSPLDTSAAKEMRDLFSGCKNLYDVDLTTIDTSAVTHMTGMFKDCESLTEVNLSGVDTSAVRNMSYMFYGCSSLASLDLSSFDMSNVTDLVEMFLGCSSLSTITVGDGYDFKSNFAMPGDDGDDSWQSADGSWHTKDEIVRSRSHVADTYSAGPLNERFVSVLPLLTGKIGLTFYADLSNLTEQERELTYATFIVGGRKKTASRADFDPSLTDPTGKHYGFTVYVGSLEMADTIVATLHFPHGNRQLTREKRTSVYKCLKNSSSLVPSRAEMLLRVISDYGYHAQKFLAATNGLSIGNGKGQYAPMTKCYTEWFDRARYASDTSEFAAQSDKAPDVKRVTSSLVLNSGTDIRVLVWPQDGATLDAPTATIDGEPAEVVKDGRAWRVTISDVAAPDLGNEHTICFTTAGGLTTVKMSGLSYAYGVFSNTDKADRLAANAMAALYGYYWNVNKVNEKR